MLIERIKASGFLSFGPTGIDLPLRPLNVFIGPNGSGKSNFIELVALLQALPTKLASRLAGSLDEWLWKGNPSASESKLELVIPQRRNHVTHSLSFADWFDNLGINDERIQCTPYTNAQSEARSDSEPLVAYEYQGGKAILREYAERRDGGTLRELSSKEINHQESVLAQFRDPDWSRYPILSNLQQAYEGIRIYRNWYFGPDSPLRRPQIAAGPAHVVTEDFSNYQRVLWNLRKTDLELLLEYVPALYEGAYEFHLDALGDTVLLSIMERGLGAIPLSRLSDGTIRYLCLLAILLNPNPSPLIVIDEPDLGLHPDLMPTMAKLLKHASKRTQVIVTTHSRQLIDALSDQPESVVVCSKDADGTHFERLNAEDLAVWLERYSLGQLWSRGELGGNRW